MNSAVTLRATYRFGYIVSLIALPLAGLYLYLFIVRHTPDMALTAVGLLLANALAFLWLARTEIRYQPKGLSYRNGLFPRQKIRADAIAYSRFGPYFTLEIYGFAPRPADAPTDAPPPPAFSPALIIYLRNFRAEDIMALLQQPWLNFQIDDAANPA